MNKEALIKEILERSVDQIIDKNHLQKKLESGKKLRVKLGIDPTSPNIHIGRSIPLLRLKRFQDLGHQVVLVIGDFTGVIGDTSDKTSERPMLSKDEVNSNLRTYKDQLGKILDIEKTEVRLNSEWLNKVTYLELCEQADQFSVNDFISRTNIKTRLQGGSRVSLREVLYPLMQGYDSVALNADVELGGTDQWFNLLAGRELQRFYGQEPQDIITHPLVPGLDGRKMSSSWGNVIKMLEEPKDMFGKLMSIGDDLIINYLEHCSLLPLDEVKTFEKKLKSGEIKPRDLKEIMAYEITKIYSGESGAREAQEFFNNVIKNKSKPDIIKEVDVKSTNIIDVLVETGIASSKSSARRLIEQGGVKVNDLPVKSTDHKLSHGDLIQKGNRTFIRIKIVS